MELGEENFLPLIIWQQHWLILNILSLEVAIILIMIFSLIAEQCILLIFPRAEEIHPLTSSVSRPVGVEVYNHAISCPAGFVSVAIGVKSVSYLRESILVYWLVCVKFWRG